MGIVKISDALHDEIRKASTPMLRSINAQAEYWIKIGMLAETHPEITFNQLMQEQMRLASVNVRQVIHG